MLQGYDFKIEHRKGPQNIVPDTLSRFDVDAFEIRGSVPEIDITSTEFGSTEYNDLKQTVSGNKDSLPDLCVIDERVYKRVNFRQGIDNEEENLWRLWLPSSLTRQAIQLGHEASWHGGYFKTLSRVRQKYYWPSMARDVKIFVSECDVCKTIKAPTQTLRPPMGDAFKTNRPFQRLYCDFLGRQHLLM